MSGRTDSGRAGCSPLLLPGLPAPHGTHAGALVELDGAAPQVEADFAAVDAICREQGAWEIRTASDDHERALLWKGLDPRKDQSDFLWPLTQAQLGAARFPVGHLTKDDVRGHARRLGLVTADKPDSQEICFVPDGDYRGFLHRRAPRVFRPGAIVNVGGRVLGRHGGVAGFTIGQRKGLGLTSSRPLYVVDLDPDAERVTVGTAEDLERDRLTAARVNFVSGDTLRNGQPSALAEDVVQFMDALRIRTAVLGGFDWGARSADIVAALWPERVKALVAVSGYLIGSQAAGQAPLPPEAELQWWYQFYFATERGRAGYDRNRHDFAKLIWQIASPQVDLLTTPSSTAARRPSTTRSGRDRDPQLPPQEAPEAFATAVER